MGDLDAGAPPLASLEIWELRPRTSLAPFGPVPCYGNCKENGYSSGPGQRDSIHVGGMLVQQTREEPEEAA